MLQSTLEQYRTQQQITALGLRQARRAGSPEAMARVISNYQLVAIAATTEAMPAVLSEQGLVAPPEGQMVPAALLTGRPTLGMLQRAATQDAADLLVTTLIQDASRTAAAVDIARRPAITGYVRSLTPPSCSRCAVLAGRVYRYSTGFQRHPRCDCLMTPTNKAEDLGLITDPTDLLAKGLVRDLSKGDKAALDAGADLGQVINVRRNQSGLIVGSSVVERAGRLTPQGILHIASDRTQAIELLRHHGYLL